MKLTRIEIINFGQFSNFALDLPDSDLNVFFGANEAGKSTIVAFIKQVMFGFHLAKHNSDFFEDYKPLARVSPMGGSLFFENDAGDHYELERLYASGKGTKRGTLTVKRNQELVPEDVFFDQIKRIDGDFYADSFIFNQDMLAKVGKIQQADLLERIYYLGAASSDKLIDLRDDFAKQASDLFKVRGSKPPLNHLLKQLQDEKMQVDEAEGEFAAYQGLSTDLKRQEKLQTKEESNLSDLQQKLGRLQQLQKLLPSYRELIALKEQSKPVNFDQDHYQAASDLAARLQDLEDARKDTQSRLQQLSQVQDESATLEKLFHQKPQLSQWQSVYQDRLEKDQQIIEDQQQLLTLNPNLGKVAAMGQEDILNLQKDYQGLPAKPAVKVQEKNTSKPNYLLLAGGGIILLGLVILASISVIGGGIILLAGLACIIAGQSRQKQVKQEQVQTQAQATSALQQRAAFTKKYGLDLDNLNLHSLVNEWREYQRQEKTLLANQQHEKDLLKRVEMLAAQLEQVLHQHVASDFKSVLTAFDQLEEQLNNHRKQANLKTTLQMNLKQNGSKIHDAKLQLQAVLARAQVKDLAEYKQLQVQKHKQDDLESKVAFLRSKLKGDTSELAQLLDKQEKAGAKQAELTQEIASQKDKVHELRSQVAEVKVKMTNLANSTAVFNAKQNLANTATRFRNMSAEYLANLLVSQWLGRALDLASNERFPKMLIAAKEYLRLLTNNRYNDIDFKAKLTVTRFDGKKIQVQYLSRGTSEQLYFALKLAFVEQIKDQINLPILIDDSFVNFDDQRIDQIKQLLGQVAQSNQVLIFTAQANLVDRLELQPLTLTKGTQNV